MPTATDAAPPRWGKLYWYGSGGEILSETDASGTTLNEYVFFGGKRIADVPNGSGALYYSEDMLGSSRVVVKSNGTLCYDADFTPFGGERAYTATCSQIYKFEGKERDTETLNDDFGARYYSWRFGRWRSSDWSAVPVAVPYANLTNPQTPNLYSMVEDDPESFADLEGHLPFWGAFQQLDDHKNCQGLASGATGGCTAATDETQPVQNAQPAPTNPDGSPQAPPLVDNKEQPIVPGVEGWKPSRRSRQLPGPLFPCISLYVGRFLSAAFSCLVASSGLASATFFRFCASFD